MYPHTAHCFRELTYIACCTCNLHSVSSVLPVPFQIASLVYRTSCSYHHNFIIHTPHCTLLVCLMQHFLFLLFCTPVALLQTLPFVVSSDIQRMQISVISKSLWSKVFSFEKSHATVLNLRGAVSNSVL